MKKNDDTIQKLFDDYAEGLNERNDLADKARQALAEQDMKKAQQRKPRIWKWLAPICAVLIFVVSFSVWARIIGVLGNFAPWQTPNYGEEDGTPPSASINYYSLSDVKGRRASASQVRDTLDVSAIEADGEYVIVCERYYAFYFEDGSLAYVKALLGVRSDEGFCEITIIAEVDGVVRNDLRDFYDEYLNGNDYAMTYTQLGEKGEYVTNACFNVANAHCYVSAMTGANDRLAEKIISKIL